MMLSDFASYVRQAHSDPVMYEAACKECGKLISAWKFQDNRRDYIRVSDAGHCVRERWATFHDALTVDQDFRGEIKMLYGSLMGAMQACLFKQAYLKNHPKATVELEVSTEGSEPGHIDILLADEAIELKSNFTFNPLGPPPSYNELQAKKYAVQAGKPKYRIHRLSVMAKGEVWEREDASTTSDDVDIKAEYDRLKAALLDTPPEG